MFSQLKQVQSLKQLLRIALISISIPFIISLLIIFILYRQHYIEQKNFLNEVANNQVSLFNAIAVYDLNTANKLKKIDPDYDPISATISQVTEGFSAYKTNRKTIEFTLASLKNDTIFFAYPVKGFDNNWKGYVPYDSEFAEPQRRALTGYSGTLTGKDYYGKKVLAAYRPVTAINMGFVVKMDYSEIRDPFIKSAWMSLVICFIVLGIGTFGFYKLIKPIFESIDDIRQKLRNESHIRKLSESELKKVEIEFRQFFDSLNSYCYMVSVDGIILDINFFAVKSLKYSKAKLVGKPFDIIFSKNNDQNSLIINQEEGSIKQHNNRTLLIKSSNGIERMVQHQEYPIVGPNGKISRYLVIQNDITDLLSAGNSLKMAESNFKGIFQSSVDGILTFRSSDLKIMNWNLSCSKLFDIPIEQAIGMKFHKLFKDFNEQNIKVILKSEGEAKLIQGKAISKHGNTIPVEISINNIDEEKRNYVCVLRDVSERVKMTRRLKAALKRSDQALMVKTHFIENLSHEIRNPLNSIIGFSEILLEQSLQDKSQERIEITSHMTTSGHQLNQTIDLMAIYSEILAGTLKVKMSEFNLGTLIRQKVKVLEIQSKMKNNIISISGDFIDTIIVGDDYLLGIALYNIIENSIKFTSDGEIIIEYIPNRKVGLLTITDTGIGVSKNNIPKVFTPYYQESQGYDKNYNGIGLGLTVCKEICNKHEINIIFESQKDSGTTVKLEFELI